MSLITVNENKLKNNNYELEIEEFLAPPATGLRRDCDGNATGMLPLRTYSQKASLLSIIGAVSDKF